MGLLFKGVNLTSISNAIGDKFSLSELSRLMEDVHGQGVNEIRIEGLSKREAALNCVEYARRHGMLADLLIGTAKRTDVEETLRRHLIQILRTNFAPFADVTRPVRTATSWLRTPPGHVRTAGTTRLDAFLKEAADTVERPDVLKGIRQTAERLLNYSRRIAPLFDLEDASLEYFVDISETQADQLEKALSAARELLSRLSRPPVSGPEARCLAALRRALDAYREALAVRDIETMHATRSVLTILLESTTPHLETCFLACTPELSFERVAVVFREVSKSLGQVQAIDRDVSPAILECYIALSYRWDIYERWRRAAGLVQNLRNSRPAAPATTDDDWLDSFNDRWLEAQTLVRTLSLLGEAEVIGAEEEQLANDVNAAMTSTALNGAVQGSEDLFRSVEAYIAFVVARAADLGAQLGRELDKLAAFRQFLQQLRAAIAATDVPPQVMQ